jgi:hypothetical protein
LTDAILDRTDMMPAKRKEWGTRQEKIFRWKFKRKMESNKVKGDVFFFH